ncbi:hypothetical protein PENTCL1PPCAC_16171, partial [Pristionchus entomophagus]
FPQWTVDAIAVAFFAQMHTMWQNISAPSVLQWLSLSRRDYSTLSKMFLAYSAPVLFHLIGWIMMTNFVPSVNFLERMVLSVNRLHGTNLSDLNIYGCPIIDDNVIDGVDAVIFDLIPSYGTSYGLFAMSAYKIRRKLLALGDVMSRKRAQMQRHFYHTQIAQI